MLKRILSGALLVALALLMTAGSAAAAIPGPMPGHSRDAPYPSPKGLVLAGSHGYEVIVAALPAERGSHAEARVRLVGPTTDIAYTVHANLAGEGIHANFGRFGRVDLRWVPSGRVREVRSHCGDGFGVGHFFFDTGSYVGTLRLGGGFGFTEVTAHRIAWRRAWYPRNYQCLIGISEGMPGPGAILGAGLKHGDSIGLFVAQNGYEERVQTYFRQIEHAGRVTIGRSAYLLGGPRTLTVGQGFRTAELSTPAPSPGPVASNGPRAPTGRGSGT